MNVPTLEQLALQGLARLESKVIISMDGRERVEQRWVIAPAGYQLMNDAMRANGLRLKADLVARRNRETEAIRNARNV